MAAYATRMTRVPRPVGKPILGRTEVSGDCTWRALRALLPARVAAPCGVGPRGCPRRARAARLAAATGGSGLPADADRVAWCSRDGGPACRRDARLAVDPVRG